MYIIMNIIVYICNTVAMQDGWIIPVHAVCICSAKEYLQDDPKYVWLGFLSPGIPCSTKKSI